jgi:serine/threonine protein kinase
MKMDKAWFIQSRQGNIKDHYFFEKKLGSGGYGAVYLAKHKLTGKLFFRKLLIVKKPLLRCVG